MYKINNKLKKGLNSILLLPLLLTNIQAAEVVENPSVHNTIENDLVMEIVEGINLSFNKIPEAIDEENARLEDLKIKAAKIDAYYAQWDLPAEGHGMDMVQAADTYNLDWRLLPALAMLETTGGKNVCVTNNFYGWGSCEISFSSAEESFYVIARSLSGNNENLPQYKDKDINKILEIYNPPATEGITPNYHKKVKNVMNEIERMDINKEILLAQK